jgi:FHA domain
MEANVSAVIAFALPVSMPIIIVAIIVIAAILALGSIWLFRGGSKKNSQVTPANGGSDWQRQAQQPGAPGNWNPQGGAGGWNPQAAPGQQAGGWGQPAQQQQGGAWGTADAAGNWGQPAQQPGGWGAQTPGQPANSWNAGGNQAAPGQPAWGTPAAQQPAANAWGVPAAQQPAANAWGNQGGQVPWDQPAQPAQPAQDPWGQAAQPAQPAQDPWGQPAQPAQPAQDPWGQAAQPANPWGTPAAQPAPQQGQQPQTAYGANNAAPAWGQSFGGVGGAQPAADPWAAQQPANNQWGSPAAPVSSPAGNPQWQQGGFPQGAPGMMQDPAMFPNNDGDKTMLRTTGPQGALGFVRVEEGKEPGRVYEVRKESLSIGRSRESDIFLEDLAVSRLHASIVNMGNGNYALKDEGSANGTKVNGQLVGKNQTYPLQEGDRIQLGQTVLVFGRH